MVWLPRNTISPHGSSVAGNGTEGLRIDDGHVLLQRVAHSLTGVGRGLLSPFELVPIRGAAR